MYLNFLDYNDDSDSLEPTSAGSVGSKLSDSDLPKPSDELLSYKKYERKTSRAGSMGSRHSSGGRHSSVSTTSRKNYAE